ncbi:unnamed protein product [Porites evermanni]|uniref:Uncharacterized protein n=1 Tax=Porites evermanni TaxID=104178 RepID=A0ABN8LDP9_9CNID|nr:unnamed protein product [Porites evermanni]
MASNNEEPSLKRFRLLEEKEPSTRFIKLDMEKYDSSVQAYSNEDLVKIFEFGLKVKESASLNLDVNQKIMKPIYETVAKIEEQVRTQVLKVQEDVNMKVNSNMTNFATN